MLIYSWKACDVKLRLSFLDVIRWEFEVNKSQEGNGGWWLNLKRHCSTVNSFNSCIQISIPYVLLNKNCMDILFFHYINFLENFVYPCICWKHNHSHEHNTFQSEWSLASNLKYNCVLRLILHIVRFITHRQNWAYCDMFRPWTHPNCEHTF